MFKREIFRRYLLPGIVFQGVVIAGGYGTGRELVEFFLSHGRVGGLLAMLAVSTVIWSAVCAVSFEFARSRKAFEYRSFSRQLLGRWWWSFEVCYLIMMLLVLAVAGAAAGSIARETFDLPYYAGVIALMACIGFLAFKGSSTIERFFWVWSGVLLAAYTTLCVWSFSRFGGDILSGLASAEIRPGWVVGGFQYAAYNVGIVPAVFFCVRHHTSRKEAVTSGLLAGLIGILPGFLFYLAMIGEYPAILSATVPANSLLERLGSRAFQLGYYVALLGTLVQTGIGLIHAFNERLAAVLIEKGVVMPSFARAVVALLLLVASTLMSRFGLAALIAKGYGTITWGFWVVFVIPVLTVGLWKVAKRTEPLEGARAVSTEPGG